MSQKLGFMRAMNKPFHAPGGPETTPAEVMSGIASPLDFVPGLDSRPAKQAMIDASRAQQAQLEAQGYVPGELGANAGAIATGAATLPYGVANAYAQPLRQPAHLLMEALRNANLPGALDPAGIASREAEAAGAVGRSIKARLGGLFGSGNRHHIGPARSGPTVGPRGY